MYRVRKLLLPTVSYMHYSLTSAVLCNVHHILMFVCQPCSVRQTPLLLLLLALVCTVLLVLLLYYYFNAALAPCCSQT
jgi:hypothetical protein